MSDITETDLMRAIIDEYRQQHKRPGDITVKDIVQAFHADGQEINDERARYIFDQWAKRPEITMLKVIDGETGKTVKVLRRK